MAKGISCGSHSLRLLGSEREPDLNTANIARMASAKEISSLISPANRMSWVCCAKNADYKAQWTSSVCLRLDTQRSQPALLLSAPVALDLAAGQRRSPSKAPKARIIESEREAALHISTIKWRWVKNGNLFWNPSKWNQGLKPAVP